MCNQQQHDKKICVVLTCSLKSVDEVNLTTLPDGMVEYFFITKELCTFKQALSIFFYYKNNTPYYMMQGFWIAIQLLLIGHKQSTYAGTAISTVLTSKLIHCKKKQLTLLYYNS